ncbi:MAG TPA: nickel-dependent hydrogenase large subunit [Candidatus Acidoferrales bacterium]|nr:nickel-dependent hydrogenase large subunit [Candidatus Acidoferrales bacterium]
MARITIDPITRIEGHLRIDAVVDGGEVQKAWASCSMWRGIETILRGRDPREAWIFTQRFCGVCTTVHAMASVRAVEDALQLEIPLNAQYIRNLILIAHGLHDHIVHFYHLSALDFVDVTTIPKADAAKAASIAQSLSDWTGNSKQEMERVQKKVLALVQSGQLGIFTNGYWGHPAMKLPPEVNLLAVAHYLQALEYQRKSNQVVAILGGKTPHIQNLAVGGVMNAINLDSLATLNMDRIYMMKDLLDEVVPFVQNVYFPDACAIAGFYADWFDIGSGVKNYMAVPDLPTDTASTQFDIPGGTIFDGDLGSVRRISSSRDEYFRKGVVEDVTHGWYQGKGAQHPWQGETIPNYTDFQDDGKYSWVKAPRFEGKPMQVGPLSTVLVSYALGDELTKKWTDLALQRVSAIAQKPITIDKMHSTMGRYLARAIRAAVLSELAVRHWALLADNIAKGDATTFNEPHFPKDAVEGVGFHEAPRGTLSHWVVVKDGVLANYQAVVPTTWNASPRDEGGVPGPYEAALLKNPVADPEKPLEILRTIHSFDPCLACACHTLDVEGKTIATVKVL